MGGEGKGGSDKNVSSSQNNEGRKRQGRGVGGQFPIIIRQEGVKKGSKE